MKKTVYLIVISIIAVAAIIFGSQMHFKKVNNKWHDFKNGITSMFEDEDGNINFSWNYHEDETTTETDGEKTGDSKSNYSGNIDATLPNFSNIKMDVKVSSVTIEEGDDFHFEADYNRSELEPKFEVKNGTLIIKSSGAKSNHGNYHCTMAVTVPRFTDLEDVDVTVNVGELDISNLKCNKLKLKTNVGEIDVRNVDFNKLDIENNVGEITIRTIDGVDDYSLDLEANIGEVNVNGHSKKHYYKVNKTSEKEIRGKSNVGEISIR